MDDVIFFIFTPKFNHTDFLFLSLLLSRLLNYYIYIVIHAIVLQVELQLRFFQLQVMLQLETIHPDR
jgi:hypothetical protein